MGDQELDPYRVLGVGRNASVLEIARARRGLARRYHPDVPGAGTGVWMRAVNEAWETLTDQDRRRAWDNAHPVSGPVTAAWVAWPGGAAPPVPANVEGSGNAGWWALGAFLILMAALLAAGLVGSLDGPDPGIVDSPVLQDNLDRP